MLIQSLIGALLQVGDSQGLLDFWQRLPAELEDSLIAAAEQLLAQAELTSDEQLVAALGPRLDGLRQIRDVQRARAVGPSPAADRRR